MARDVSTRTYLVFNRTQAAVLLAAARQAHYELRAELFPFDGGGMLVAQDDLAALADFDGTLISRLRLPAGARMA